MLTKDPGARGNFSIDWAPFLAEGETIATSVWTVVVAAGVTISDEQQTGTTTTVVVDDGTNGQIAQLRNVITTTAGNEWPKTIDIEIVDPANLPLGSLPISLAAVKVRLDIETGDLDAEGEANTDAQVLGALRAAVDYVEAQSLRILRKRLVSKSFNCWPCWPFCIQGSPMRDVLSVTYLDEDGAQQTLDPAAWDWVPTADGAQLFLTDQPFSAPRLRYGHPQAVTVNFEAGYDPVGTVPRVEVYALPARLEQAVVMMTGHLFTNRDAVGTERAYEVPLGVENLMINARLYR